MNVRINVHSDAVDADNPAFDVSGNALGLTGAIDFGPSTLSLVNHMLIELEVPLEIPSNFGNGNSVFGNGLDPVGGNGYAGYSPDPAFWGGNFANDIVDPPASSAIFQILPNGNTIITPTAPFAPVPEPSTLALMVSGGVTGLLAFRRSRKRAG